MMRYLKLWLRVGDRGWGTWLELHMGEDPVDELDIVTLVGHEVGPVRVGVGDDVLVSQESVSITGITGRRRILHHLK